MATAEARAKAEGLRIHVLNIALAAKAGRDGDLREATEHLIAAAAKSFDDFRKQR